MREIRSFTPRPTLAESRAEQIEKAEEAKRRRWLAPRVQDIPVDPGIGLPLAGRVPGRLS